LKLTKWFIVLSLSSLLLGTCDSSDSLQSRYKLDIDIGDYEGQLAAWNSLNMLDYRIKVKYCLRWTAVTTVKNGIPESDDPPGKKLTIPAFYSFIKEEEHRIRDSYKKGWAYCNFYVTYNDEYHYPNWIFSEDSHTGSSGEYWEITLTPPGD